MQKIQMTDIQDHPMDHFPVRSLEFDRAKLAVLDPVWSRSSPQFAVFINALGVHVPYFERYLIHALRKAKEVIQDAPLLRDISNIIGQEAHHAKNFIQLNKRLANRYPKIGQHEEGAKAYFAHHAKADSLKQLVGFTAGYETFTFLAGLIILDGYDEWLADSDPVMKAMWVWHQVEEVEHGSVAFEVYQHLYGEDELYRKWMIVKALSHIAWETIKSYTHMARTEGWLSTPLKAMCTMGFCAKMLLKLLRNALPVFSKRYHPRKHPKVTSDQNDIQIAWRRYAQAGGDVLEIDHQKMACIMAGKAV
jgi:predicted metal-dependent hydrolase